jgi:CRP-like cAMP-binding protein
VIPPRTLCVLQGHGFAELFSGHPELALSLLQARVEEEQRMDIRLSLLGRSTAEQRIAYLVLETMPYDSIRATYVEVAI